MADIIRRKIEKGHEAVLSSIAQIRETGRNPVQARVRLYGLSEHLLAHWDLQNKKFYDDLYRRYEGNREVTKMLDFLAHDLKDLKIQYLVFFDKYGEDTLSHFSSGFLKDFVAFSDEIIARINAEREYLMVFTAD